MHHRGQVSGSLTKIGSGWMVQLSALVSMGTRADNLYYVVKTIIWRDVGFGLNRALEALDNPLKGLSLA